MQRKFVNKHQRFGQSLAHGLLMVGIASVVLIMSGNAANADWTGAVGTKQLAHGEWPTIYQTLPTPVSTTGKFVQFKNGQPVFTNLYPNEPSGPAAIGKKLPLSAAYGLTWQYFIPATKMECTKNNVGAKCALGNLATVPINGKGNWGIAVPNGNQIPGVVGSTDPGAYRTTGVCTDLSNYYFGLGISSEMGLNGEKKGAYSLQACCAIELGGTAQGTADNSNTVRSVSTPWTWNWYMGASDGITDASGNNTNIRCDLQQVHFKTVSTTPPQMDEMSDLQALMAVLLGSAMIWYTGRRKPS